YYNDVKMEYGDSVAHGTPSADFYTGEGRVIDDEGIGFDLSNTSRFNLGNISVTSINGVEYFHDDVTSYNKLSSALEGGVNPSGKSSVGGVFTENTFSYNIVDVIAGLRYDFYTLKGDIEVAANNAVGLPVGTYDLDKSEGRVDPRITVALNPYEWLQ